MVEIQRSSPSMYRREHGMAGRQWFEPCIPPLLAQQRMDDQAGAGIRAGEKNPLTHPDHFSIPCVSEKRGGFLSWKQ